MSASGVLFSGVESAGFEAGSEAKGVGLAFVHVTTIVRRHFVGIGRAALSAAVSAQYVQSTPSATEWHGGRLPSFHGSTSYGMEYVVRTAAQPAAWTAVRSGSRTNTRMEPTGRVELPTFRLTSGCSGTELRGRVVFIGAP